MHTPAAETQTNKRSSRLAQLIRVYESGDISELMDRTLEKLFSIEASEAQKDVEELRADLLRFEERFGMKSEDFYNRFETGELGDDTDFIEWASFFDMYRHAKSRLSLLGGEA